MAISEVLARRTNSDVVFDTLYDQIIQLELLPGAKISEADIAKQFGVSRQPVREAFTRLANLNLLLIRPQRATIVRPFSEVIIANARFVRTAVELEVVRALSMDRDQSLDAEIDANMAAQQHAAQDGDADAFHELDYQFHKLLCEAAGKPFAFDIIASNKAQVDRLCMLSLTDRQAMETLLDDHKALRNALFSGDAAAAETLLRMHLDRLTPTIEKIRTDHRIFFDD